MKFSTKNTVLKINVTILFLILFLTPPLFSDVRTQFVPTVSITEEYTDNYNQTQNNKDDEFSTIYSAGFSFGVIDKNWDVFLNYNPAYTDYDTHDEDDNWSHYAFLQGQYQAAEHTSFTLSQSFVRNVEEHDYFTTIAGVIHEFGQRDNIGMNYSYSFDKYDDENADENKTHNPSAFLSYWFTPQYGLDLGGGYEKTDFDLSDEDDSETWSGNIKFLKAMNRHLDIYAAYEQTETQQDSGDQSTYYPSIGFDWQPTEDSQISIGAGVLFQEWDNENDDSKEAFFLNLDMYKDYNFSRRGVFSITGSSGYDPNSSDAASLGFHIYYQAGCLLSYKLTKRLTAEFDAAYAIDQYDDPEVDRQDNTFDFGAGLVWSPLKWLSLNLSYGFTDFDTDDNTRDDYQENVGSLTITMTPSQPVRFGSSNPRADLENRLFN
jgi:hypothetical protein